MRRTVSTLAIAGTLLILLAACDPAGEPSPSTSTPGSSPSAEPSGSPTPVADGRPDRADLALGPDGMGTLVFGEAPPSGEAAMLALEADWCADEVTGYGLGISAGDPEAAIWVPIPEYRDGRAYDFGVAVTDGVVDRIDLYDGTIPTTAGVRIGDARAAVHAAYPGAAVVSGTLSDIYVVTGPHGSLQIEVTTSDPYWTGFLPPDVVAYIHAVRTGVGPFSVVASENIAGGCPS